MAGEEPRRSRHPGWIIVGTTVGVWAVFVFAKGLLAVERFGAEILLDWASVADWLVRDAAVTVMWALIATLVVLAARRASRPMLLVASALMASYVGLNIAFFRSFSTPLNRQLMGMAGGVGDLSDSARELLTFTNLWPTTVCIAVAIAVPLTLWSMRGRVAGAVCAGSAATVVITLAVAGVTESDTTPMGLDRNAVWEAVLLPIPRATAQAATQSLDISEPIARLSLVDPTAHRVDHTELAGTAAGMNVVLVVLESTSARYIGAYGADDDPMPRVSALAANSLMFDAWYAPVPTSMKCMFSYLCSTWPYPDAIAESQLQPRLPCHSLPEVLSEAGYEGTFVTSARFAFNNKLQFLEDRGYSSLWDADNLPADDETFRNTWGIDERAALAQMKTFLAERQGSDAPFFLTYVPIFPHHPYMVPPDEPVNYGIVAPFDRYRDGLRHTDTVVGELLDTLRDNGQLDNTLVVVIGDHGEPFGQHPGNRMHSNAIYEENVHVPALFWNPTLFPETVHVSSPVDHTALAPTLTELLGLTTPDRWQGSSALSGPRDMARFFTDYSFLMLGVRDGDFKYIYDFANETDELYDLSVDPLETVNIASERPSLVTAYRDHVVYAYYRQISLFDNYDDYLHGDLSLPDYMPLENLAPVFTQVGWGKLRPDMSAGIKPLTIDGVVYDDGLGTHAPGRVRYDLSGRYTWFEGAVGRDYNAFDGELTAEVYVDDVRVFASGPLLRTSAAVPFGVDVTGAQSLELVIGIGADDTKRGDHADWVDVRLR